MDREELKKSIERLRERRSRLRPIEPHSVAIMRKRPSVEAFDIPFEDDVQVNLPEDNKQMEGGDTNG